MYETAWESEFLHTMLKLFRVLEPSQIAATSDSFLEMFSVTPRNTI